MELISRRPLVRNVRLAASRCGWISEELLKKTLIITESYMVHLHQLENRDLNLSSVGPARIIFWTSRRWIVEDGQDGNGYTKHVVDHSKHSQELLR